LNSGSAIFGDITCKNIDGDKMNYDIYGFIIGADVCVSNRWTVGILYRYGKGKIKYKDDYLGSLDSMFDDILANLSLKPSRGDADLQSFNESFRSNNSH
jgi:opacity protein-like surface antigen